MNKKTLLNNIKYIAFGLVVAIGLSFAHADFATPAATAPGANIPAPIHTGPDQDKGAGLSVDTLIVNQNAVLLQQAFLNSTVYGGSPTSTSSTSTVNIGDASGGANMAVNGNLSASSYIKSASVANGGSLSLCATANGTIVTCGS